MFRVVEVIRERKVFDLVEVGFMECNEPSIPQAIQKLVESGANSISAVPYFLHTGTHVADDLPGLLEAAARRYTSVDFSMGRYIGASSLLTPILADRAVAGTSGAPS